jgi:hypothetical protein
VEAGQGRAGQRKRRYGSVVRGGAGCTVATQMQMDVLRGV